MATLQTPDSDGWNDLPELDGDADEPDGGPQLEIPPEIEPLDEEDARDHDDANAVDLEIGLDLDGGLEAGEDSAHGDLVLDIGELLSEEDEREYGDEGETGPEEFDIAAGIQELPQDRAQLDDEPSRGDFEDVLDEELPGLDADEEGELGDELLGVALGSSLGGDPQRLARAERTWTQERVANTPFTALASVGRTRVAGGRELVSLDESGAVRRLGVPASSVWSLVLVGEHADSVLYSTALGGLVRQRLGAHPERYEAWRRAAGISADTGETLDLSQPSAAHGSTLLARTQAGQLLRSTDGGATFELVELGGKARALSARCDPALVLVEADGAQRLCRSSDGGVSFEDVPLDPIANALLAAGTPRLLGRGPVVIIATEGEGVAVRYADGAAFTPIAGTSNVSAITIGVENGTDTIWISVFEEMAATSAIVRVVRGTAECIAELRGSGTSRDDEANDEASVAALDWDEDHSTLWAAGAFGLVSLKLPEPSAP